MVTGSISRGDLSKIFRDSSWILTRLINRQRFLINLSICWSNENRMSSSAPLARLLSVFSERAGINELMLSTRSRLELKGSWYPCRIQKCAYRSQTCLSLVVSVVRYFYSEILTSSFSLSAHFLVIRFCCFLMVKTWHLLWWCWWCFDC